MINEYYIKLHSVVVVRLFPGSTISQNHSNTKTQKKHKETDDDTTNENKET